MKILPFFLAFLSLGSCGKKAQDANSVTIVPPSSQNFLRPQGAKCSLIGQTGQKDVFLNITGTEEAYHVSFHEYLEPGRVTLMGANFDGFELAQFPLIKQVQKNRNVLLGSTEVIQLVGPDKRVKRHLRVSIDKDMTGRIETITEESEDSEFQVLAMIDHCEKDDPTGLRPLQLKLTEE